VLKSWAIPKGPSLDPADKRLAMHVEDHPLEYGDFEGVIPKGQYGGGTVLLWDRGTWEPVGDPHRSYRAGSLKFKLHGKKLRGGFALVRIAGRRQSRDEGRSWLLIKERDAEAASGGSTPIVESQPKSVASGRAIEQIAAAADRVWNSNRDGDTATAPPEVTGAKVTGEEAQRTPMVAGVRLTHADRVLYPRLGTTKLDLARFYESIAKWILPHLEGRPTTLVRCPEGVHKSCFYQKHTGYWAPESLRRVKIQEKRKVGEYLIVDSLASLIGLVQIGILEIHTWNSVVDRLEQPDRVVFDLDPGPGVTWAEVIECARLIRDGLKAVRLASFVKTTGGKGLHVVVPITPGPSWDETAEFARVVAEWTVRNNPRRYVARMAKSARRGKIFVDYLRNVRGATSVAAYSTRAKPEATISVPLAWDELSPRITSDHFTLANLRTRLDGLKTDPWAAYWKTRQKLPDGGGR
jgi:bifunctional non-homologous end joining protein LigD